MGQLLMDLFHREGSGRFYSQGSSDRKRTNKRERWRGIFFFFFKKVTHLVMEADKSEICRAGRLEISGSMNLTLMRQSISVFSVKAIN